MIAIVDYGLGNIQAFANIYKRLNVDARIANCCKDLNGVDKLILPGVGAFDWAMTLINNSGMRALLDELVIDRGLPVLGICVGMQVMAKRSEEGHLDGLAWIDAEVKRFDESSFFQSTRLPHMGWNDTYLKCEDDLFGGLEYDSRFYFLHSYYFAPRNGCNVLTTTDYNGSFASSVRYKNRFGVQFHPEKSHQWGIQLLKNFAEL